MLIYMASGRYPVEKVNEGDWALARDEQTGEQTYRQVTRTFVKPDLPVRELEFQTQDGSTETLRVTSEHPFWVKDRGWVEAAELLPGDEVFTSAGGWVRVSNGTWVSQRQTVYNFEVEGFHSYFVGESGVWVHNTSCLLFPNDADDFTKMIGMDPVSDQISKKHGTRYVQWQPSSGTRIKYESHPADIKPGGSFHPRHHGIHYHIEHIDTTKITWKEVDKTFKKKGFKGVKKLQQKGCYWKTIPPGYKKGHGTGYIPGETLPGS